MFYFDLCVGHCTVRDLCGSIRWLIEDHMGPTAKEGAHTKRIVHWHALKKNMHFHWIYSITMIIGNWECSVVHLNYNFQ